MTDFPIINLIAIPVSLIALIVSLWLEYNPFVVKPDHKTHSEVYRVGGVLFPKSMSLVPFLLMRSVFFLVIAMVLAWISFTRVGLSVVNSTLYALIMVFAFLTGVGIVSARKLYETAEIDSHLSCLVQFSFITGLSAASFLMLYEKFISAPFSDEHIVWLLASIATISAIFIGFDLVSRKVAVRLAQTDVASMKEKWLVGLAIMPGFVLVAGTWSVYEILQLVENHPTGILFALEALVSAVGIVTFVVVQATVYANFYRKARQVFLIEGSRIIKYFQRRRDALTKLMKEIDKEEKGGVRRHLPPEMLAFLLERGGLSREDLHSGVGEASNILPDVYYDGIVYPPNRAGLYLFDDDYWNDYWRSRAFNDDHFSQH